MKLNGNLKQYLDAIYQLLPGGSFKKGTKHPERVRPDGSACLCNNLIV